jgi:tetratricopeptide (TPR) repeat protein
VRPSGYLTICLFLVVILAVFTLPVFAQAAQAKAPQIKTQSEFDAYNACFREKDPVKKADLCQKFVDDFKDSELLVNGYKLILQSYYQSQNWKLVMDAVDRVVALPIADSNLKGYAYERAMVAAQNSNNSDKCVTYGNKVLAIDEDNLNALLTVSTLIVQQYASDATQLQRAGAMARKALLMLASRMDKAATQDKPQFVLVDGTVHATLGLISYDQKDYKKSIQEYQAAVKDNAKDDGSHFYMAFGYLNLMAQASQEHQRRSRQSTMRRLLRQISQPVMSLVGAKRPNFEDDIRKYRNTVIDELAIAVAINGPYAVQAKRELTKQWTAKNKSAAGLDEFVKQKKTEIGG